MDYNNPKLYCGTYGKYNNGSIAGKWMDLTEYDTADDFLKACAELHKDESDPEFMFQDFECFPERMYSESMSTEDIEKLIEYAHLSEEQRELVDDFCDATSESFGTYSIEQIEDAHVFTADKNSWMSIEEQYGYECADMGCIDIPDEIRSYFDFEAYGRDMMENAQEANGKLFVLS